MAKQRSAIDYVGKVKIRVIEFEVEGNDETMQESLKSIAVALNRGANVSPQTQPRMRNVPPAARELGEQSDVSESDETDSNDAEENEETIIPSRKLVSPAKPRFMKLLTEITFNDVTPTLKEFAGTKAPKTDMHRYLVIAYWFKHHKATPGLNPDHFFTAYRHMQWPVPVDPASPIKDLRNKRRTQLSAGANKGLSTINHVGEEIVLKMGTASE